MQKRRIDSLYPDYFAFPALLVYSVFFTIPILAAFLLSFTDWHIMRLFSPHFIGIENFVYLFKDTNFILALKNTFIFAFFTMVFKVLFGLLLALALVQPLKTKNILRTIFYMPAVLSIVIAGVLFQALFKSNGFLNAFLTAVGLDGWVTDWIGNPKTALFTTIVVEIWRWSGFTMAILIAGLQNISHDYYESAQIDGSSAWQRFLFITLPLLRPALTITIVMHTIGGLKVFEQVFVITAGGPGFASQVLGTYIFTAFAQGRLGRSTAMGLILFLLVFAVSYSVNKVLKREEADI